MGTQEYKDGFDYCLKNKNLFYKLIKKNANISNLIDFEELFNEVSILIAKKWNNYDDSKKVSRNTYFGLIAKRKIDEYNLKYKLKFSYSHNALTNRKLGYLDIGLARETKVVNIDSKEYLNEVLSITDSYDSDIIIDIKLNKQAIKKYINKNFSILEKTMFYKKYNEELDEINSNRDCSQYFKLEQHTIWHRYKVLQNRLKKHLEQGV